MGKRFWMAMLLLVCASGAVAAGPSAVRKQIEASLLVKGTLDIDASGAVVGHELERRDDLPPGVVEMIGKAMPHWRFELVALEDGTSPARVDMSLRIVAKELDDDSFSVHIRGARFGQHQPGEIVSAKSLAPPRYPSAAVDSGVGGTVYLVVKVGRDGSVEEVVAEQVNLRIVAREREMIRWRRVLAQAAVRRAKDWTFNPPPRGDEVDEPYWSARVPVDFTFADAREPNEHEWNAYVPGPRERVPWLSEPSDDGADAIAAGGIYPVGGGPRLLTSLDPG
ncbi:protein tonB [Lysobacter sp. D1-1-M9]|uniref:protein tonB n=1 Tax=Novilysobacter longmucuonensis TaxID=3098603 RepID=UPI002FCBB6A2